MTPLTRSDSRGRRAFLRWMLSSPIAAAAMAQTESVSPPQAEINLLDFEAAAKKALPPAHFGYLATGVDDDRTLHANREGFQRFYLRPRRLIDISKQADLRTELFGTVWDSPIGLAPVGNQKAFHDEGEVPVARAAKSKKALQILSTYGNTSVEDVAKELGRAPWYQLYPTSRWEVTERLVKRAEAAGCPVFLLTVDTQAGRHTETFSRSKLVDKRPCAACHGTKPEDFYKRKPMLSGVDVVGLRTGNPALSWKHVEQLRKMTSMKFLIKGIETAEDAALCVQAGVDGVIVSNHGGRAGESGRGTIEALPEVVQAASGRIPVLIDGGFRRGTDVFKALALGARGVFIGRPYVWGLAAYGQPGVERVIDLLRLEFELVMKQCGARSIAEISPKMVGVRGA